jgi:O-acetyl-ADP-ribose deacetylase (regulator of RNase III)
MITYLTGDATDPKIPGNKIIAHVCNDIGAWGRGFVLSLSKRWQKPEKQYRSWFSQQENSLIDPELSSKLTIGYPLELGAVQYVRVELRDVSEEKCEYTYIANMIGQRGILDNDGLPPIRYDALEICLRDVASFAYNTSSSVHMPRIGCGLAGGKWQEIEPLIEKCFGGIGVYVYDFETGDARTVKWKK